MNTNEVERGDSDNEDDGHGFAGSDPGDDDDEGDSSEDSEGLHIQQQLEVAPAELLALFAQFHLHNRQKQHAESHEDLLALLKKSEKLTDEEEFRAFAAVDRGTYCRSDQSSLSDIYSDRPYHCLLAADYKIHLSAPHIYATCVQALRLKPGQSFLNLGSGTGCALALKLVNP